jgi:hypothetical protein
MTKCIGERGPPGKAGDSGNPGSPGGLGQQGIIGPPGEDARYCELCPKRPGKQQHIVPTKANTNKPTTNRVGVDWRTNLYQSSLIRRRPEAVEVAKVLCLRVKVVINGQNYRRSNRTHQR